jgi:predicted protein tyrosine phosphatase
MHTKTKEIFETTAPYSNACQGSYHRALFVCSAGMLRSATAAFVGNSLGMNTRACGSESYALIPLTANLILWADTIYFVNEYNYYGALQQFMEYPTLDAEIRRKAVVWDIEDIYDYRDPKLVQILTKLLS